MSAAEVDPQVAQRYLLKRQLGKGAYGIVWKAVDRRTGEAVAIKKILEAFRDNMDAQVIKGGSTKTRTFREVMLLWEFGNHPNIIRLLDVIQVENNRDIYLVFESMDTDLNAVIRKGQLLKDIHKRYIFYQLLRATKFIHSGGVIHRDQKPSNVLLDASCLVKLCDFGLACPLSGLPEGPKGQALTEYVATRWYRAPEVLLSSHWYTTSMDMWSLGCILGEMLRGGALFPGTSTLHQLELVLQTVPPPSKEELLALGSGCGTSILQHLGTRPRQTLGALLPADTPPDALDLLRRLLVFAPDQRLTAAQALQHPYVRRFHCPAREWTLQGQVRLPVHERVPLTASEYRSRLYQMILQRRGRSRLVREKGLGGDPQPPACTLQPRAVCQLPPGRPAQDLAHRPQNSPSHNPEHDDPRGAKNVPRQSLAPLLRPPPQGGAEGGERPPVATVESPSAPSWVKPRVQGEAPSLAAQAAARVAVQALIRRDGGPAERQEGSRRVSLQHPQEAWLKPRPGRRMFRASASQGGPGVREGGSRGILPRLRYHLPLSDRPPVPAPRTPHMTGDPHLLLCSTSGIVLPTVRELPSRPSAFHHPSFACPQWSTGELVQSSLGNMRVPLQPQWWPPIKSRLFPAYLMPFTLRRGTPRSHTPFHSSPLEDPYTVTRDSCLPSSQPCAPGSQHLRQPGEGGRGHT